MHVLCHISLESSQRELQLLFKPHLHQRSAQEAMSLQIHERPNFGNFETPNLGVPK
jgi:hypothetical protein